MSTQPAARCTVRVGRAPTCARPMLHLHGTPGRSDVWLCAHCDMGNASAAAGPPRLLAYLRTGDKA